MKMIDEANDALVRLAPASVVFVEIATPAGQKTKFKTRYIGYLPEYFILLQMPDLSKNPKLTRFINESAHCTVRGLVEGQQGLVIAYQTTIKQTLKSPTWMVALAIPKKVAIQQLRKTNRIQTTLAVEAKVNNINFNATMLDLSPRGCLLEVVSANKNLDVKIGSTLTLSVRDDEVNAAAPISGVICNMKQVASCENIGVKFDEQCDAQVMALLNQVWLADD